MKASPTNTNGIHNYFIIGACLALLGLVFYFISPFITTLFMAAVIYTAFAPIHRRVKTKIKKRVLSSLIMWLGILVLFIVPVSLLGWLLVKEAVNISTQLNISASQWPVFLEQLPRLAEPYMPKNVTWHEKLNPQNLANLGSNLASNLSSVLLKSATGVIAGLSLFFLHLIIFLFALFYLFLDGERLYNYVRALLPLTEHQKNELTKKTTDLMQSIIYGIFGAAIAQGSLVGIGMALVGFENVLFWGFISTLLAPVPYVGVGLIWVPTTIYLFSSGSWGQGVFFLAWCLIFVINIDNIIKPYLIGAKSLLHPFALMVVIIGGVLTLGFKGLVFGPLLLTLLIAFLHIYQLEFKPSNTKAKSNSTGK